jgi:hypothetical protein
MMLTLISGQHTKEIEPDLSPHARLHSMSSIITKLLEINESMGCTLSIASSRVT